VSLKQNRHRLLLDEMFPPRSRFPNLNKYHDLKHVVKDFHLGGVSDDKVVKLAKKENRILISKNSKHMIYLCQASEVKLMCLTEKMEWEEIDKAIMSTLRNTPKTEWLTKLVRPVRKLRMGQ
jgi:predicted nuclease of predicted toxin-antitoxin system